MARRSHRKKRVVNAIRQLPWGDVANPYAPIQVISDDHVETIVETALQVLANQGMRFLQPASRKMMQEAGAEVDEAEKIVRFDPDLVREKLQHAPPEFELRARNPEHDLKVGGNNIIFGSVGGPAFCSDLDKGRRPGTYEEMCDYLRVIQSLNIIQQEGGGPFEAMDLPGETRHLDLYLAQIRLLDKNWQAYALGRERTVDAIDMAWC
jgi:trimethylamine--corrinoid protein Co-methyltransferase